MKDIPRLLPFWLILLFVMLFATCGCRTGGTWINPGSAGTIITGKTPEQMNEEAKARREESEKFQNAQPVQSPQVILPPARSKPKDTSAQSVEANPVVVNPKPAGKKEPFTPTVSTAPIKLPPEKLPPVKLPPAKTEAELPSRIVEGGCVITADDPQIAGPCEAAPGEGKAVATNWVNLFSLFAILLIGAIGFWVVYDMIRDSIQMKKQGMPIKDHLKNLKKPAKGTRASRKKATTKKKTTRKKKS